MYHRAWKAAYNSCYARLWKWKENLPRQTEGPAYAGEITNKAGISDKKFVFANRRFDVWLVVKFLRSRNMSYKPDSCAALYAAAAARAR
jgi:hypothetical protein